VYSAPKHWWMLPKKSIEKFLFLAEGFENTKIIAKTWANFREIFRKNFCETKFCKKRANFACFRFKKGFSFQP
jgi:hypothetical protein